jgi:hypothetical protein
MICQPCTEGDHCGPPGQSSPSCPCQHRNPGAWKGDKPKEPEE